MAETNENVRGNNSNALVPYAVGVGKPTVMIEDLHLLSRWVKTDLFEMVKFLYEPETELKVDELLYKLFVRDCKDRLVGLQGPTAKGPYRKLYVELLWLEANKKKTNLVANGLTTRRSTVYSAMQSRFVGKLRCRTITCYNDTNTQCLSPEICRYCVDQKTVLPCLEAFEMGIELPVVYFMFYEYFFKSSVGDSRWKKSCTEGNEASSPLGTVHAEAFAMLLLKNNYFAWLLEAKETYGEKLVTDYDNDKEEGKISAAEAFLGNVQFNVNGGIEEDIVIPEGCANYAFLNEISQGKAKMWW
jgi:hypothetical protein